MKNIFLVSMLLVFAITSINAQFSDNMESYVDGEPISEGHWTDYGCGGGIGCEIMSTSAIVHTGDLAGLIPDDGTTDAILDLGNKIFGHWRLEFWMYVPTGKEAFWSLQGCVPICAQDWGIQFFFNQNNGSPGEGLVTDSALGQVSFSFPHDTWFRVYMDWDVNSGISNATWYLSINNTVILPYNTPFTNSIGEIPASVGGINFYSINAGSNLYYLDNFIFCDEFDPAGPCTLLGVDELKSNTFSAFPNPITNDLYLQAKQEMAAVSIHNVLGQEVYSAKIEALNFRVDMSSFARGTYFVTVISENNQETIKVVK